jgi:multidrug resistance protein, MATE family
LIAYLIISLPLSYLFGIVFEGGAAGVWMAFPFGLTTAGILYYRRFRKISLIPGT